MYKCSEGFISSSGDNSERWSVVVSDLHVCESLKTSMSENTSKMTLYTLMS